MSFIAVIFIVVAFLLMYYVGMIVYDIYAANQAQAETEVSSEVPIDVSDQLSGFESHEISKPDESTVRKQNFLQFVCQGLTVAKWNELMNDAATGKTNPVLDNIYYMLEEMERQGLSEEEMEEVVKAYEQTDSAE